MSLRGYTVAAINGTSAHNVIPPYSTICIPVAVLGF